MYGRLQGARRWPDRSKCAAPFGRNDRLLPVGGVERARRHGDAAPSRQVRGDCRVSEHCQGDRDADVLNGHEHALPVAAQRAAAIGSARSHNRDRSMGSPSVRWRHSAPSNLASNSSSGSASTAAIAAAMANACRAASPVGVHRGGAGVPLDPVAGRATSRYDSERERQMPDEGLDNRQTSSSPPHRDTLRPGDPAAHAAASSAASRPQKSPREGQSAARRPVGPSQASGDAPTASPCNSTSQVAQISAGPRPSQRKTGRVLALTAGTGVHQRRSMPRADHDAAGRPEAPQVRRAMMCDIIAQAGRTPRNLICRYDLRSQPTGRRGGKHHAHRGCRHGAAPPSVLRRRSARTAHEACCQPG